MNENALTYENHLKQHRYDVAYLKMAIEWARLSHCTRKQVGAIIVKNGMIISDGYNGTPSGFDNCCENDNNETHWYVLHAEANAILKLAKSTNSGEGATLYITLSPCKDCSKLILQAGIKRVVYMNAYKDDEGIAFLSKSDIQITHIPVLENE
ncbi:MAG: dCMP deaminase family protein [Bacteroidetes bacterium]|nr:dCMP deaminase family protein [Bacteroidota bacterium]